MSVLITGRLGPDELSVAAFSFMLATVGKSATFSPQAVILNLLSSSRLVRGVGWERGHAATYADATAAGSIQNTSQMWPSGSWKPCPYMKPWSCG